MLAAYGKGSADELEWNGMEAETTPETRQLSSSGTKNCREQRIRSADRDIWADLRYFGGIKNDVEAI